MKKIALLLFILIGVIVSCDTDSNYELYFIGDSIVSRWDSDESINYAVSHNLGLSGSGIEYLKSLAGTQTGHNVVIVSGTNDVGKLKDEEAIVLYAKEYLNAIESLNAERVYLFSILPRNFKNEYNLNPTIKCLNAEISDMVEGKTNICYMDVYGKFMDGDHIDYELYSDGLHLSQQGYEILSSTLIKYLRK